MYHTVVFYNRMRDTATHFLTTARLLATELHPDNVVSDIAGKHRLVVVVEFPTSPSTGVVLEENIWGNAP